MKALTTIKTTALNTFCIYNSDNEMIATAKKLDAKDERAANGEYLIAMFGGVAHGKIAYAKDFQDLNDKSVEIANLPR